MTRPADQATSTVRRVPGVQPHGVGLAGESDTSKSAPALMGLDKARRVLRDRAVEMGADEARVGSSAEQAHEMYLNRKALLLLADEHSLGAVSWCAANRCSMVAVQACAESARRPASAGLKDVAEAVLLLLAHHSRKAEEMGDYDRVSALQSEREAVAVSLAELHRRRSESPPSVSA